MTIATNILHEFSGGHVTLATPPLQKFLRGHVRTIPGNMHTKLKGHSFNRLTLSHRMRRQHGPLWQRPPQPAANVRIGNAEHRVGTAAIRRRPQSVSKKLNMFNFCRRLLRVHAVFSANSAVFCGTNTV